MGKRQSNYNTKHKKNKHPKPATAREKQWMRQEVERLKQRSSLDDVYSPNGEQKKYKTTINKNERTSAKVGKS